MSTIQSQLTSMQNITAQSQAAAKKETGATQELGQDAFLMLMLEQLKHQDPMNPMNNQEFLSQQAQFTQLNEIQKMNKNMSINNQIMQASSLIGKQVSIVDPDDSSKRINGVVEAANFSGSDSTVVVGGKDYPLGYVVKVSNPGDASTGGESTADSSNNQTT